MNSLPFQVPENEEQREIKAILLSNRAMAHLKLQEYGKAEADCCGALDLKPDHVKSLTRRATARRRLGRFKLALVDLRKAQGLDPSSGEILSDIKLVESKLREQKQKAKEKLVKKLLLFVQTHIHI